MAKRYSYPYGACGYCLGIIRNNDGGEYLDPICNFILKKIGKDKKFARFLAANRDTIQRRIDIAKIPVIIGSYTRGRTVENYGIEVAANKAYKKYPDINAFFKEDFNPLTKYLSEKGVQLPLYADYFRACTELGMDMSDRKNLFPHDFMRWHDIRIDEAATLKAERDKERRKAFYERFAAVSEKYEKMQDMRRSDTFIVTIAKSPGDLIREGEKLGHCVGGMGYDQKFVREESLIFFLRMASQPDEPFVTIEYSVKDRKILQQHGYRNSPPTAEAAEYIAGVWLPFANREMKKATEVVACAIS